VIKPRIVTPHEAQDALRLDYFDIRRVPDLLDTVATEPDRIRAAVVKALRTASEVVSRVPGIGPTDLLNEFANTIENGAD
jgi:hypothetical protein